MCGILGIRVAFSQAYHHQANGRAEKAGQQLMERLRRLQIEDKLTWVEALPRVLDRLHDTPGETGLTPYQILFGRHRPLAGIPYAPPAESEDANVFFARQKEVDQKVADHLNRVHQRQAGATNKNRVMGEVFLAGEKVWYLRPENSGNKLDSRWLGPALVISREGIFSYVVEIKPDYRVKAHVTALKPYKEDVVLGEPTPLFYHRRTVPDPEAAPDEWIVEEILEHRLERDGSYKFLTKWQASEERTWEPVGNFFHRYSSDLVAYCQKHGLGLDVIRYLSPVPHAE